jgi:hypothetical protein
MKDLEDLLQSSFICPIKLQFDGLSPGMRLHNKTILDKPFFDINLIQQMQNILRIWFRCHQSKL